MRYRDWLDKHADNFDQIYSSTTIKKKRNTLDELVGKHEQTTFDLIRLIGLEENQDSQD